MAAPSPKQRAVTMKRNGMDDSLVGAVLGISADDVQSLVYDANPDVSLGDEPPAGIPEVAYRVAKTLTHAELINLPSSPVELVPAPASGEMLLPISAALFMLGATTSPAFSNISSADGSEFIAIGNPVGARLSRVWGPSMPFILCTDGAALMAPESEVAPGATSQTLAQVTTGSELGALSIFARLADFAPAFTGGNGVERLGVSVLYSVLELP